MRLAMIATPGAMADLRPVLGALDGDVLRSRLPLPDTGFKIVDLDPAEDLAEQIDIALDSAAIPKGTEILFYASTAVVLSVDGEPFLCLDPAHPETGDSLRDIALVFRERASGPVGFVLELRYVAEAGGARRSAAIVPSIQDAVGGPTSGIDLLISVRPSNATDVGDRPSPFTRALIEALDDPDAQSGLTLGAFFETVRDDEAIIRAVTCISHTGGQTPFALLPLMARVGPPPRLINTPKASPPLPTARPKPVSARPPEVLGARPALAAAPAPRTPTSAPPPRTMTSAPPPRTMTSAPPPSSSSPSDNVRVGDELLRAGDSESALVAFKRALGALPTHAAVDRAEIYVRLGKVKQRQEKRREAIANFDKALSLFPVPVGDKSSVPPMHLAAMEALLDLNLAEGDFRAVHAAEERLLAISSSPDERFERLMAAASRWQTLAGDAARARATLERARELRPDDLEVLERLLALYVVTGAFTDAFSTRRRIADLTRNPRLKAERYFELGKALLDLGREDPGLELLDLALEADPTMLEPLALVARALAERQEWGELELSYRRMLERVERIPKGQIRTEVTWELCRRLGLLFRDHLEDPALALDAFEDAVTERPDDLAGRLTAIDLARAVGKNDRASVHLEAVAALDPTRVETFHALFEVSQKLRRPDQAYQAACVSVFLKQADARERFVFEEHHPEGVIKPSHALRGEEWEWLRVSGRDVCAEAVLAAVTPAAIGARLAELAKEDRLPDLDPNERQDREHSTLSIVRSFAWASHFLGVDAPDIYLRDDPSLSIASVIAETPTIVAGNQVLRGRTLPELAFFVGRHLAYHVGSHRLLLFYPSIEDLTACFLAAAKIVLPEIVSPSPLRPLVAALEPAIAARLSEDDRVDLAAAVAAFEANGSRVRLSEWAAAVERCATRVGLLLAGDLNLAADVLRAEPAGLLDAEAKVSDLLGFAVSSQHHALRLSLGIAVQP